MPIWLIATPQIPSIPNYVKVHDIIQHATQYINYMGFILLTPRPGKQPLPIVVYSYCMHCDLRMTRPNIPSASGLASQMAELPSATLHPRWEMKVTRKTDQNRKETKRKDQSLLSLLPAPESASVPTLSLNSFGREHPDLRSRQEVHHRLITLFYGKLPRDQHALAIAHWCGWRDLTKFTRAYHSWLFLTLWPPYQWRPYCAILRFACKVWSAEHYPRVVVWEESHSAPQCTDVWTSLWLWRVADRWNLPKQYNINSNLWSQ